MAVGAAAQDRAKVDPALLLVGAGIHHARKRFSHWKSTQSLTPDSVKPQTPVDTLAGRRVVDGG
jgi:hypothetical protein